MMEVTLADSCGAPSDVVLTTPNLPIVEHVLNLIHIDVFQRQFEDETEHILPIGQAIDSPLSELLKSGQRQLCRRGCRECSGCNLAEDHERHPKPRAAAGICF